MKFGKKKEKPEKKPGKHKHEFRHFATVDRNGTETIVWVCKDWPKCRSKMETEA